MSLWVLLPLIPSALNLLLILVVLRSNWRGPLHRVLSLFLLALAVWAFAVFGLRASPTLEGALVWQRVALAVGPLGAVLYYHFTVLLTRPASAISRRLIPSGYLLVLVFLFLLPTDLLVKGNQLKFYGPAPILGSAFFLYVTLLYCFVALGIINLWREARRSPSHQERNRAAYIIVGTLCFLAGGLSDFLPVMGLRIYPMGMVGNLLFCLFTTIAIVRHQLLDIRIVMRRGLAYGIVSAVVVGMYVGLIFPVTLLFGTQRISLWANIVIMFVLAIALQPVLRWVQRLVDRLFYRERYGHLRALEEFSRETQSVTDLDGLSSALTSTVALAMQAKAAYLVLKSPQTSDFVLHSSVGSEGSSNGSLSASSVFITWLERNDELIRARDLDILPEFKGLKANERRFLDDLGGEIYVPLKTPGGLAGVLVLTPKLTGEPYSGEDTALLWTLAGQTAMSIENARLFAEEKERAALLRTLEQMKSDLLVSASHQLKTPLTSVRVATDVLAEDEEKEPSPTRHSMILTLRAGVDALQKLVNEVLDFAKMQAAILEIHRRPCDITVLIRDVVFLLTPTLQRKKQDIEMDLPATMPTTLIDPQRVEQVLANLLENASKFTPRHGHITVRARENDDNSVVVAVEDTGPGVPEGEQLRIFEPYYQVTSSGGYYAGSGLGLAIAKSLVLLHGGKIWLQSKPGGGSTFFFSLPLRETDESSVHDGAYSLTQHSLPE